MNDGIGSQTNRIISLFLDSPQYSIVEWLFIWPKPYKRFMGGLPKLVINVCLFLNSKKSRSIFCLPELFQHFTVSQNSKKQDRKLESSLDFTKRHNLSAERYQPWWDNELISLLLYRFCVWPWKGAKTLVIKTKAFYGTEIEEMVKISVDHIINMILFNKHSFPLYVNCKWIYLLW